MQEITEEVSAAKDLFTKASDILGYDLLQLCVEGTDSAYLIRQCWLYQCTY